MNYLQLSSRQVLFVKVDFPVFNLFQRYNVSSLLIKASDSSVPTYKAIASPQDFRGGQNDKSLVTSNAVEKKLVRKSGKKEHHLWKRRDQIGSGHKALNLVRTICGLANEKEAVYSALDEWIAWETEFPLIAAAKALVILRQRSQWKRIIQVAKWMLSKGQGATMATYDHLLLAFDMDRRPDEAEMLWNMILHAHDRSISKRLFSRMISLYDHHNMANNVIEVFADMEELGVKPDEDTVRRIARAFEVLGQEDKQKQFLTKYQRKWKYIHFKGERARVRT
ncbi:pentatricopeptide repeat-containing protein At4g18975, chloroplastic-like [Salvia miltiorrhiza]|uniref:pentatricopeptide repeat-containing protein At4g18975, chloroplastic-like n=1 Tax=Salvia miltiorrhiza TaxID=226208 RepID=UPI0025AC94D6|nr:pentatricopeptide repeat-containing protein At4g18975, chloroplastic-like [Salvia miltiorrhiza]